MPAHYQFSDNLIIVRFAYDQDLVDCIKRVPGRKWEPSIRAWTVPDSQVSRSFLKANGFTAIGPCLAEPVQEQVPYRHVTTPFDHQRRMTCAIMADQHVMIAAETGTGKTKAVIDAIANARQLAPALVVCPAPLLATWQREIAQHQPSLTSAIYHGPKRKLSPLSDATVTITSYDILVNDLKKLATNCFRSAFFDESQLVKNPAAKRTKAALKLSRTTRCWCLSGTPLANTWMDLWSQISICEPKAFGSKQAFVDAFCNLDEWGRPESYRNKDLFTAICERTMMVIRKADCLDLPPKIYQTVELPSTPEQRKHNRLALAGVALGEPLTTSVSRIVKLRTIASGFLYDSSGSATVVIPCAKHEWLRDVSLDQPTIVWVNFRKEVADIASVLQNRGITYLIADGDNDAADTAQRFQAGEAQVLIANIASIQYGVTLTRATYVVYWSGTYSHMQRQQSEDRAHRIGTTQRVTYVTLCCCPIEKEMLSAIEAKADVEEWLLRNILSNVT